VERSGRVALRLKNIGIGRKFAVLSVLGVGQLACVGGISLYALHASTAASVKAALFAHKMVAAVQVSDQLSQLELIITNLGRSHQIQQELDRFMKLRKQYMDGLEYLTRTATDPEEGPLLARMDRVLADWRRANNPF
jgi:hypothetical protein